LRHLGFHEIELMLDAPLRVGRDLTAPTKVRAATDKNAARKNPSSDLGAGRAQVRLRLGYRGLAIKRPL
jgi:hypothetical protein